MTRTSDQPLKARAGAADMNAMTDCAVFEAIVTAPEEEAPSAFSALPAAERRNPARFLPWVKENRPERMLSMLKLIAGVEGCTPPAAVLFELLGESDPAVRTASAVILGRTLRSPDAIEHLLEHPDSRVRSGVLEGIRSWNRSSELLWKALRDPHHRVVTTAIVSLYSISQQQAIAVLHRCLAHSSWRFRAAGTWAIGAIGDPGLRELAEQMLRDKHASVRWNALRALSALHRADRR